MNVRIGMTQTPKELEIELGEDQKGQEIIDEVSKAVGDESTQMVWLTDRKGRRVGVVTSKIAWIELGPEAEGRRVGFSAI